MLDGFHGICFVRDFRWNSERIIEGFGFYRDSMGFQWDRNSNSRKMMLGSFTLANLRMILSTRCQPLDLGPFPGSATYWFGHC